MDSALYSVKQLALKDIQKVIDSLGDFAESTLNAHSLVLVINSTGEATFSSCGGKLLSEAGFSYPLTKFISNAALSYTKLCGDDCKYFIFILREMFKIMYSKVSGCDEVFIRRNLMSEIHSLKQVLPCIFKAVQEASGVHTAKLGPDSFFKDLHSVVLTFMLARFSVNVSKILSSLICDFVEKINTDDSSLKFNLDYIISHFDIFCCKILSPVSESKVLDGPLLYRKGIPSDFNLENCKFIVILDLSMKLEMKDVSWKITDVSFVSQLNSLSVYQKVFQYFKSQGIELILSCSACDSNLKLLCEKNGIFLFDRLEKEEIQCMLTCFNLYALENLNESIESHHIGKIGFAKSFSCNESHFLHLKCINSVRLFNVHHMLLSAPCNAIWKEYYSECLNCFKMIHQWLKLDVNLCFQNNPINEDLLNTSMHNLSIHNEIKNCCMCYNLETSYKNENEKNMPIINMKSCENIGIALTPCLWELQFKNILTKIPENLSLSCNTVLYAMQLAIVKTLCKRIGIPLANVKDIESTCAEFMKKCKMGDISFLEPIVCKEILINNVLDLLLQLLKIESIVFIK